MSDATVSTRITLKGVRFSYMYVWKPKPAKEGDEGSSPKYAATIMVPKTGKYAAENIAGVEKIIEHLTGIAKEKNKIKGKLPKDFRMGWRDGDDEADEFPEYAGHFFINATSSTQPGIVSTQKDADNNPKPIKNEDEVYSGMYGHASVNFFHYDKKGNGIGCGLNNIMKTADGERFGGGKSSAKEDFKDIDLDDDF